MTLSLRKSRFVLPSKNENIDHCDQKKERGKSAPSRLKKESSPQKQRSVQSCNSNELANKKPRRGTRIGQPKQSGRKTRCKSAVKKDQDSCDQDQTAVAMFSADFLPAKDNGNLPCLPSKKAEKSSETFDQDEKIQHSKKVTPKDLIADKLTWRLSSFDYDKDKYLNLLNASRRILSFAASSKHSSLPCTFDDVYLPKPAGPAKVTPQTGEQEDGSYPFSSNFTSFSLTSRKTSAADGLDPPSELKKEPSTDSGVQCNSSSSSSTENERSLRSTLSSTTTPSTTSSSSASSSASSSSDLSSSYSSAESSPTNSSLKSENASPFNSGSKSAKKSSKKHKGRTMKRKAQRFKLLLPPVRPAPDAEKSKVVQYIYNLQKYMNRLTYNLHGSENFHIKTQASLITHHATAKTMIRDCLPIKCMEATILGIYLTSSVPGLGRFPINFKSEIHDLTFRPGRKYYYHVVLGLVYQGKFGAVGLSRKPNLMDKPLHFKSLFDLVLEYKTSYTDCRHTLWKVRIGDLVSHEEFCVSPIPWKGINIKNQNQHNGFILDRDKVDRYGTYLKNKIRFQIS